MMARSELKLVFTGLMTQYAGAGRVFDSYWKEIVEAYQEEKRHYHNLDHLDHIHKKLEESGQKPKNRAAVLFAMFYHDLVYEVPNHKNEERSAEIGEKRMTGLGVDRNTIDLCIKHILATKEHLGTGDPDTDLFCDADISILGERGSLYDDYCRKIRREYFNVPEIEFASGRTLELKKLLGMKRIFKTENFYNRFEQVARKNLTNEIDKLSRQAAPHKKTPD